MKIDNNGFDADASIDRLKEISTWVSSVQDLDQLLELIIETATRMMDAKASSLLLLDPRTKKLYFKVATGAKKEDVKRFESELGQGIAGYVAQTGESLLIPDVLANETVNLLLLTLFSMRSGKSPKIISPSRPEDRSVSAVLSPLTM